MNRLTVLILGAFVVMSGGVAAQEGMPGSQIDLNNLQVITSDNVRELQMLARIEGFAPDVTWGNNVLAIARGDRVHIYDLNNLDQPVQELTVDVPVVNSIAISPDGELLAASQGILTSEEAIPILIFNLDEAGEPSFLVTRNNEIYGVLIEDMEFSPDGEYLATAGLDSYAYLWDVDTNTELFSFYVGQGSFVLTFSPDGSMLATGGFDGYVRLWSVVNGEQIGFLQTGVGFVSDITFNRDGTLLASSTNGNIQLWDMNSRTLTNSLAFASNHLAYSLAFTADEGTLIFTEIDGMTPVGSLPRSTIRAWNVKDNSAIVIWESESSDFARILNLEMQPDNRMFAFTPFDNEVQVWAVRE